MFKDEKDTWDCWRAMSCSVGIERCAFERGRKERFALCQKWKEYRNERRGHKWGGVLPPSPVVLGSCTGSDTQPNAILSMEATLYERYDETRYIV